MFLSVLSIQKSVILSLTVLLFDKMHDDTSLLLYFLTFHNSYYVSAKYGQILSFFNLNFYTKCLYIKTETTFLISDRSSGSRK